MLAKTYKLILKHRSLLIAFAVSLIFTLSVFSQADISGDLMKWHKITLTFNGPNVSETSNPNPFTQYRLNVTFTHQSGSPSYVVPGYWAADGDAANSSAANGNKWRVNFPPDKTGTWNYSVSFRTGANISINTSPNAGSSAGFMDGETGSFLVAPTNKTGKDFRATGRAEYVGEHYLQYQETGKWMVKGGADAPENTMAYNDFDATPNQGNRRKTWQPHQQDYLASEASQYTWKNGKGTELLGVVRYLSDIKGVNALSFLTFSLDGDDDNVYPHRQKQANANSWGQVDHNRFDVSKMAQWGKIFDYATAKGVFLHFKTHETENDQLMNDTEGKIYYRELVARYAHNLALVWNISEEISIDNNQIKSWLNFLDTIDPYQHARGFHTFPGGKGRYNQFTGNQAPMTYCSLQSGLSAGKNDTQTWVNNSRNAGKRWVVCFDEQGGAGTGVKCDPKDNDKVLRDVIWGTLMNGGMGFEFYYGYQTCQSDLNAQDHRTRDTKYTWAGHALKFFDEYFNEYLPDVRPADNITGATNDEVIKNVDETAFAVFLPNGGSTSINLPAGDWFVSWYNAKNGNMGSPSAHSGNLVAPSNAAWVALLTSQAVPIRADAGPDQNVLDIDGSGDELITLDGSGSTADSTIISYVWTKGNIEIATGISPSVTLGQGTHNITLTVTDSDSNTDNDTVSITIEPLPDYPDIPGRIQAEDFTDQSGIQTQATSDVGGGENVGWIHDGDWTEYMVDVLQGGIYEVTFRVASAVASGGTITVSFDGLDVVTVDVPGTNGWQNWINVTATTNVSLTAGPAQKMRWSFTGSFNINWADFATTQPVEPDANAGPDQTVRDNDNNGSEIITLDGSASSDSDGTIVSYVWSEGGSDIATGVNPDVTLGLGVHTITLTVTDNDGLSDTDTVVITVLEYVPTPPTADAGPDQTVTDNDRNDVEIVTLDGSGSNDPDGTIVSYVWTEGGTPIAAGVSPDVTLSIGEHTITLTVTDNENQTDTDTVVITVLPYTTIPPVANAGTDQSIVDEDENGSEMVTLDGSGSNDPDGTIASYVWTKGGIEIASGINPDVTLTLGEHIITLSVTDNDNLTHTDDVKITILEGGIGQSIPGTIEAESFDQGAYYDTDAANKGSAGIRLDEGVDIDNKNGIICIGWCAAGEWTEYSIKAAQTGTYKVLYSFSTNKNKNPKSFSFSLDGISIGTVNIAGNDPINNSGNNVFATRELGEIVIEDTGVKVLRWTAGSNAICFDKVEFQFVGIVDTEAPTVPTGLAVTGVGENTVDLTWNASTDDGSGVAGYRVYADGSQVADIAGLSATISGLSCDTLYSFTVSAYDNAEIENESAQSGAVPATTTACTSTEITVNLSPIHDAYLQGNSRYNNNLIRIEAGKRVGYLMFDLSSVNGPITDAQLKLVCTSDSGSGNVKVNFGTSSSWTENNLSSSNKPGSGDQLANKNSNYSVGSAYTWILNTAPLSGGGNMSLIVTHTSGNDVAFGSKENSAANKPVLTITYTGTE